MPPGMKTPLFGQSKAKNGKKAGLMIVLYQQGLEDVAAQLSAMGYRVHPMSSRIPADAVLYVSDLRGALHVRAGARGTAMVCARGLNAAQIAAALARRGCAPLF